MFAYSAACLLLLSFSYSNLICLITPKQPPASFTPDVKQLDECDFFHRCCSLLEARRLPDRRTWLWFLLLLCLSRYVLLLA